MGPVASLRRPSIVVTSALLLAACGGGDDASLARIETLPPVATSVPPTATTSFVTSVLDDPVAGDVRTVGGLRTAIDVRRPTIVSGNPAAIFVSAVELPDGTVLATGVDSGLDGSGTDSGAIWRSVDGGATFERLDLGHPTELRRDIDAFVQIDGVAYLFGDDADGGGTAKVWSSVDRGESWDEQVVADGFVSWGGVVGGLPTIAVAGPHPSGGGTEATMHQRRDGTWQRVPTPDAGDAAIVWSVAELPSGVAVAVGERCETDPGYQGPGTCTSGGPDATIDGLGWVSRDGGATWLDESPWLGGAPGSQSAGAIAVVGDEALIGITGSTIGGDAFTIVLNSTTDGAGWSGFGTMPTWNGGTDPVWFDDIAPLGAGVIGLLSTTADDRTRPLALLHDTATGAQELVELSTTTPIRLFDLVTIGGTVHGVGVAAEDGSATPVLVAFDVVP